MSKIISLVAVFISILSFGLQIWDYMSKNVIPYGVFINYDEIQIIEESLK
jgi:hypothetical protein